MRHRAFKSVDKQQAAVGHVEHAFHLAAEVGVSGGVDDVYLVAFIVDGNVLGKNSYATFTFKVVVVKNKLAGVLILTKKVACQEHFIH